MLGESQNNLTSFDGREEVETLEDLILDIDLARLENLTKSFNIFESIGAVRRETRHSDFLSFLLNPSENHGLHDSFLKSFLFHLTKSNRSISSISPIDVDLYDLSSTEVSREWENIDILLISRSEGFVCAIENKIDSTEHSNQLSRYESTIEKNFGDYRKTFVYLTLDGSAPKNNTNWLTYSYEQIFGLLNELLPAFLNVIGDDVYTLIKHYSEIINRHLMSENEIAELSRKIYQRHKRAIDIIFEHKPDALNETNAKVLEVLGYQSNLNFEMDHCTKGYVRFAVTRWDTQRGQCSGDGQWTKSNRVVLFEIINHSTDIAIKLVGGPGNHEFREKLFLATSSDTKLFNRVA